MRVDYDPSAEGVKVAVIHLRGEIHESMAAEMSVALQSTVGADYVVVDIDSPGGMLGASEDIMLDLIEAPQKVVCLAHTAASGAFGIFQACKLRLMVPDGVLMLHQARPIEPAKDAAALARQQADLAEINERWTKVACFRMDITLDQCRVAVAGNREVWLTPAEAVAVGAADAVAPDLDTIVQMLRYPRG